MALLAGCTGREQFSASSGWSGVALGPASEKAYVGVREGRIVALNTANGGRLAMYPPAGQDPIEGLYSTPAVAGDTVLVGGYDGKLYALDAAMNLLWQFPSDASDIEQIVGGMAVEGDTAVFGASDHTVRAVSLSTGSLLWEYETDNLVWSTPTIADGIVYVGSLDHSLYAINLVGGRLAWSYKADGAIVMQPLVLDGKVIFGSFDANLYAVDLNGNEVWRMPGDGWFWASPITDGQRVYATTAKGTVYGVHPATGSAAWKFSMNSKTLSTPVIVAGALVVGGDDGVLHVLATATGNRTSQYNVGAEVRAPLTTDGEIVYVHSMDRKVWAIRMVGRQELVWQANTEQLSQG